jgi:holo-[acyl-carrier protein] synthase
MIVGIGVDLVEVERIAQALNHPRTGQRFCARVFTPAEIAYCQQRRRSAESFAARFAAKEATIKALGSFLPWRDIEVVRERGAAPRLVLHGRARARAEELGVCGIHLSLTHTAAWALAWVVAEAAETHRLDE